MRRLSAVLAGFAVVLISCDAATGPDAQIPRPEGEFPALPEGGGPGGTDPGGAEPPGVDENGLPIFLRFGAGLVPENRTVSFWAVQGKNREAKIRNAVTGKDLVKLKIGSQTLMQHPDGRPLATNDSVLITMTLDPEGRVAAGFSPAGLGFNSGEGAELTIAYDAADPDFNADGTVDGSDAAAEDLFAIWRQGAAGEPFAPRTSGRDRVTRKVTTVIQSFSRYAIAY